MQVPRSAVACSRRHEVELVILAVVLICSFGLGLAVARSSLSLVLFLMARGIHRATS